MQELIKQIRELKERVLKALAAAEIDCKKKKIIELQHEMSRPGFWNNQAKARVISQEVSGLEQEVLGWEGIKQAVQDLLEIVELDKDDQIVNLRADAEKQLAALEKRFAALEFGLLFRGKYDGLPAIVAIYAGAGGTDAQDWAEMLLRMYLRFCESQGWKTRIISISSGAEAGLKSAQFEVAGKNSYGYLKAEAGVHRLVRISPFDAEKMRHTSFAMVEVLPILEKATEVAVRPEDLRVDTFRAGGHGGQGVNKTDSAVRITHLPTGIIATCQNERSQLQNKETALKILASKLEQYYAAEQEEERARLRGEYTEAAWGNQIRSYVIHPYKMVKDHRTGHETGDVDAVLNGDLLEFIEAHLRHSVKY